MASITIEQLPDRVWQALNRSALAHARSVEAEAADWLARSTPPEDSATVTELLTQIRASRSGLERAGVWLCQDEIEKAISQGRE